MNKGLAIALFASLAVNIFLGGFLAGRLIGAPERPVFDRSPHGAGVMMFHDLEALSPQGREAFRAVFAARRGALRERHREVVARRADFFAALAAEPWDRERTEKALARLKAATDQQETAFTDLLIDAFENLSAADRKALVEAGARGGRWSRRHRARRPSPPPALDQPPPSSENG